MRAHDFMRRRFFSERAWCAILSRREGAQLVEFAVVMPLLVVLVVGIADFGSGYALKDKMTNAARDGTRAAVSEPDDLTNAQSTACNGAPCSAQAAATVAVNYLFNASVNVCGPNTWPSTTKPTGNLSAGWTYTSPQNCPGTSSPMTVLVERSFHTTLNGKIILLTRVTITYPFKWTFGNVIKLLIPTASYANTLTLTAVAIMPNLN